MTLRVKPGYPGKTAGVTVDPSNGDLFMVVPDQGLWKSVNHGKTFDASTARRSAAAARPALPSTSIPAENG